MNAEVLARQKRRDRYQLIAEYEPSRLVRIIAAQSPPVPKSQTKTVSDARPGQPAVAPGRKTDGCRPQALRSLCRGVTPVARFLPHPTLGHPHELGLQIDVIAMRRCPKQTIDPFAHKEADLAVQAWGAPLEFRISIESPLILLTRSQLSHGEFSSGLRCVFRDKRLVTRTNCNRRHPYEDLPVPMMAVVPRDDQANHLFGAEHFAGSRCSATNLERRDQD